LNSSMVIFEQKVQNILLMLCEEILWV